MGDPADDDQRDAGADRADPSAARAALHEHDARRLEALERALVASWLAPRPELAAVEALSELDPERLAVMSPAGVDEARWVAHTLGGRPGGEALAEREQLRDLHLDGRPLGLERQLTMVVHDDHQPRLFVGLYRRAGAVPFEPTARALLLAALPALREWALLAAAIGAEPLGDGALTTMLGALDEPAVLVRGGAVVHANASGQRFVDATLRWLEAGSPGGFATVTPLLPRGVAVDLVLPQGAAVEGLTDLPPSLARVAGLLARGLADKDIALELGLPLATVRTYVARTLKRLDARGRRELMVRLREDDGSSGSE